MLAADRQNLAVELPSLRGLRILSLVACVAWVHIEHTVQRHFEQYAHSSCLSSFDNWEMGDMVHPDSAYSESSGDHDWL